MNFETSIPAPEKEPRFLTLEEIKAKIENCVVKKIRKQSGHSRMKKVSICMRSSS
jgi:hypothetical protein